MEWGCESVRSAESGSEMTAFVLFFVTVALSADGTDTDVTYPGTDMFSVKRDEVSSSASCCPYTAATRSVYSSADMVSPVKSGAMNSSVYEAVSSGKRDMMYCAVSGDNLNESEPFPAALPSMRMASGSFGRMASALSGPVESENCEPFWEMPEAVSPAALSDETAGPV